MRTLKLALCGAAFAGLAACGDNFNEQALIGAGAGAATAVVVDGNPFVGAVVGSAANVIFCKENPGRCN
ncbi:hypothetical protein [Shimia sp. SDUM112013]|uniref:hypothetical protein n=1 Tax=Shimia sp. SDUM112013 TaxID=3136160 RepID=UPI0032EBAA71